MNTQLPLNLRLRDGSSFNNFSGARNREAAERLTAAVTAIATGSAVVERVFFAWGESGTGKTHLLEAACRHAHELGAAPVYIPLADAAMLSPALLEDLESAPLVCLDDVQRIAGAAGWEKALFALYERLRTAGGMLVAAGNAPPNRLGLTLPDLATRLGWGVVYQLHPLRDDERSAAVRLRARNRGLDISEEVLHYLLTRYPRDLHSMFDLLERIDRQSLARQRRITIPFIKELENRSP